MVSISQRYQHYQAWTPSLVASRPPLSYSPLRRVYLSYELPWLVSPCHFMSRPFLANRLSHFRFGQTWSETKTLQILLKNFWITDLLMLFPREALFACPPSPQWSPPSVWPPFFSPRCSSRSPWLSPISHDLVIWTDGSVLFLLAKAALASFPTAHFVAPRPPFSFRQAHFV